MGTTEDTSTTYVYVLNQLKLGYIERNLKSTPNKLEKGIYLTFSKAVGMSVMYWSWGFLVSFGPQG